MKYNLLMSATSTNKNLDGIIKQVVSPGYFQKKVFARASAESLRTSLTSFLFSYELIGLVGWEGCNRLKCLISAKTFSESLLDSLVQSETCQRGLRGRFIVGWTIVLHVLMNEFMSPLDWGRGSLGGIPVGFVLALSRLIFFINNLKMT